MSMEYTDEDVARIVTSWRDRLLKRAFCAIDRHWFDKPVEDFTDEERGFERGLSVAQKEIVNLMHDKSRYRSPAPTDRSEVRP